MNSGQINIALLPLSANEKSDPYIGDVEASVIPLSEAGMLESYGPSALFIDIRARRSYENGHLSNAINIPYSDYRKQRRRSKYRDHIDCTKRSSSKVWGMDDAMK